MATNCWPSTPKRQHSLALCRHRRHAHQLCPGRRRRHGLRRPRRRTPVRPGAALTASRAGSVERMAEWQYLRQLQVSGEVLVAGGYKEKLYGLDLADGRQRWAFSAGNFINSQHVADGVAYLWSPTGWLYAIDTARQRALAPSHHRLPRRQRQLGAGDGRTGDGRRQALRPRSGQRAARTGHRQRRGDRPSDTAGSGATLGAATARRGELLFGSRDGVLFAGRLLNMAPPLRQVSEYPLAASVPHQ
jgi:hypothetical protein